MCGAGATQTPDALFRITLEALPVALQEEIWMLLGLHDIARAATVCRQWALLSKRVLEGRLEINATEDLPLLCRQHNFLLLRDGYSGTGPGDSGGGAAALRLKHRLIGYVPAALHYASQHCRSLQRVHLELQPPQVPLAAAPDAVARAVAGEPWQAQPPLAALVAVAADLGCPPVDGYILKLLAQSCPELRGLRLVNVTNNSAMNRLARLNDSCLALLARSCPLLEELVVGHRGGEECVFNPSAAFYLEDVTDLGLRALAQNSSRLRRLGLLRCSRVGDEGLALVAQMCRQLTSLMLHDCPGISDRALLEVGEHCTQLRSLHCTVARRSGSLLMMGEEGEQLGFRALFTIAANCPLLEDLCISEEGLEAPVVDDDCCICIAQGCRQLTRLVLRHCGAVTDAGARAVALRCKQLQELVLEHTTVGDAGVEAVARGLPLLRTLCLTNYISSLAHLAFLPGGAARRVRGVSDAGLGHIARHCTALRQLAITGCRRVTDAGLLHLAHRPAPAAPTNTNASAPDVPLVPMAAAGKLPAELVPAVSFHRQLTSLAINHTAATDGSVCQLLDQCGELRALSLRGLLYNADATVARVADSCRHLTSLDLRHCSTLSDAGLRDVSRIRFLRSLHLSFCVRITDGGLQQLTAGASTAKYASYNCNLHEASQGGSSNSSAGNRVKSSPCGSSPGPHLHRSSTSHDWGTGSGPALGRRAVHRSVSSSEAQPVGVWDAVASAASAAAQDGATISGEAGKKGSSTLRSSEGGKCRRSMLQEIELYHVPQVTHRGIRALVEECADMKHINIGKCRLVKVENLEVLLNTRGVRLSACHYLDTA